MLSGCCQKKPKDKKSRGRAIDPSWSIARIKKHLSNCQVLCKNCHVVETYKNKEMHNSHKMWKVRQTKQRNYTARMMRAHTTRTLEDLFE